MKLNSKSVVFSVICSIISASANAQSIQDVEGLIWPDVDFKNVQYLTYGHLIKNKPRYGKYNWKVIETNHFRIFSYGDENLYNYYGRKSEEVYEKFSGQTNINDFEDKIAVVIFNSSRDFEEANIIEGLVPKGLGGQTEMIKWKRVVIAYRDSPQGFERLLKHELMHRYQAQLLKLTRINFTFRGVPLWFTEGSSEHYAHEWDTRGELVMRDAYLNNYLAHVDRPSAWYNSLIYKQGEYITHFIAEEYKDRGEVLISILRDVVDMDFANAFKKNTGDTLEEFDKKLFRHIEKQYSHLRAKTDIADEAKNITNGTLLSARGQFTVTRKSVGAREILYLNWSNGTETVSKKLVVTGYLSALDVRGFEVELSPEFGFQEHGASLSSDDTVIYAMDVGSHDKIVIQKFKFDSNKKKFKLGKNKKYLVPGVREVQYPVMLNTSEVSFVGRADGVSAELYKMDLDSGSIHKLTDAKRTYRSLTYSKSRNSLITSAENENTGSYDLAEYRLADGSFRYLTQTPENEFSAVASSDGNRLLYNSDKGKNHNIHRLDLETGKDEVLTDAKIGVFRPQWFSDGLTFNWFSKGDMTVKVAPLPDRIRMETAIKEKSVAPKIIWDLPGIKKLRNKIPGIESITLMDAALCPDTSSAIFVENRRLAMDAPGRKESELRFHHVDAVTENVTSFEVPELEKIKHYGSIRVLPGTNVLLQKKTVTHEKVGSIHDEGNMEIETEVTYKQSFIYDWSDEKKHDVNTEIISAYDDSSLSAMQISPGGRYLIWTNKDRTKIIVYDTLTKEKREIDHSFYEIQKVVFVSNEKLMVLDKKWQFSFALIDIRENKVQTWGPKITEELKYNVTAEWFPVRNGEKNYIIIPVKNQGLNVFIFDTVNGNATPVASEIPLVKKAEVDGENLVLTIANEYGLDRKITISPDGKIEKTDEKFSESKVHASKKLELGQDVQPRNWNIGTPAPYKLGKLSKIPKPLHAFLAGGIFFGGKSTGFFISGIGIALDEVSDRAVLAEVLLQNGSYGIADIQYYDRVNNREYLLDYWNLDGYRKKLNVGIRQRIFLHQLRNLDITFKQQHMRNRRDSVTTEWWRSNIGLTHSIDTTKWDCESGYWTCHGPNSGYAIFTGVEASADNRKGFQAFDLNLDARYHLPITDRGGLAFRTIGGKSFGNNPTTFVWGGNGTMRGIPLFSEAGNAYAMQTTELRFPILNAAGAVLSGPIGEAFAPLTVYIDIRGGIYHDIGDMWYYDTPRFSGHKGMKIEQGAGYFVNIPTAIGLHLRFNKGLYGRREWNFWLGYNW